MTLPGQIATELPDGSLAISRAVSIEDGARAAVLLVPDAVRLDLRPYGDTLEVQVRAVNEETGRWYTGDTPGQWVQPAALALRPGAQSVVVEIGDRQVDITLSLTRLAQDAGMRVVAQARVTRFGGASGSRRSRSRPRLRPAAP